MSTATRQELFIWPRKKRSWRVAVLILFGVLLGGMSGCNHVGSTSTGTGNSSTNSFVVTVTASGGTGAQAVSHSVTLQVTVQ